MKNQTKLRLKNRLHRLEGQLRGIEAMIDADRENNEIVQQLWAVRQSLTSAILYLIEAEEDAQLLFKMFKRF
jgi:DNA-binding FrmR family transcriptional regulator